jgi:hypothetical protein
MDGHCRSSDEQRAFSFTIGSLSLAEDLALLVVPMTIVWRLQLARAKKIRVVILFGLGGMYGCPQSSLVLACIQYREYGPDLLMHIPTECA